MSNVDVRIKLDGLKEMSKTIEKLPKEFRRFAYKAVITAGGNVIARYIRRRTPKDTGLLRRSIGVRAIVYPSGIPYAVVGPRRNILGQPRVITTKSGGTRTVTPAPWRYSHLVEFGTAHSDAIPFISPAVQLAEGETLEAMANRLEKSLDQILKRVKK